MNHVTLTRGHYGQDVTMGLLKIEGVEHEPLYTLELPWRDNKNGVSCIPVGRYSCRVRRKHSFPKITIVYEILNVKDRTDVLFHYGNTVNDIKGCVLVGRSAGFMTPLGGIKPLPAALDTVNGMKKMISLLGEKEFTLEIR